MKFEIVRAALMEKLKSDWKGPHAVPLEWPNRKFAEPSGPWAKVVLLFGNRGSAAVGNKRTRSVGSLSLELFVEKESGSKKAYQAADLMASIFDILQMTPEPSTVIEFDHVSVFGPFTRENHDQYSIRAGFRVDVTQ